MSIKSLVLLFVSSLLLAETTQAPSIPAALGQEIAMQQRDLLLVQQRLSTSIAQADKVCAATVGFTFDQITIKCVNAKDKPTK